MLRLPAFELLAPRTLDDALSALGRFHGQAMVIAGGTDLLPNMKHELFTPKVLVSLEGLAELRGVEVQGEGWLRIGAMTTLAEVAASELVAARAPALAQAAGLISGPQLRTMGTLGGNVLLDTRCQWYNQTYFWRQALGFCLKKDGTLCHVVEKGNKCVAAASNDSAPALMTLDAVLEIASVRGTRRVPINDFWVADGIVNRAIEKDEILVAVHVPPTASGHRGAYGKLRERGSIDFPMLGIAARIDLEDSGSIADADLVAVAIAARPVRVRAARETLRGERPGASAFDRALDSLCESAFKQLRPLANIPGDETWRREMIPIYLRRTVRAALEGTGPVHHL